MADRSADTFEHLLDAAAPEHCRKNSSTTSFGSAEMDISSFLMVKESTENTAVLRSLVEVGSGWIVVTPPSLHAGIRLSLFSSDRSSSLWSSWGFYVGSAGRCNAGMLKLGVGCCHSASFVKSDRRTCRPLIGADWRKSGATFWRGGHFSEEIGFIVAREVGSKVPKSGLREEDTPQVRVKVRKIRVEAGRHPKI